MEKREAIVDLVNKVVCAQGDIQRAVIWLLRLEKDLDNLMRELITWRDYEHATEK